MNKTDKIAAYTFCGLFGLFLLGTVGNCAAGVVGLHKEAAEATGMQFSKDLGLDTESVSCVKLDTDGDGYLSCTFKTKSEVLQYECTGWMTLNEGCREPKLRLSKTSNRG